MCLKNTIKYHILFSWKHLKNRPDLVPRGSRGTEQARWRGRIENINASGKCISIVCLVPGDALLTPAMKTQRLES